MVEAATTPSSPMRAVHTKPSLFRAPSRPSGIAPGYVRINRRDEKEPTLTGALTRPRSMADRIHKGQFRQFPFLAVPFAFFRAARLVVLNAARFVLDQQHPAALEERLHALPGVVAVVAEGINVDGEPAHLLRAAVTDEALHGLRRRQS